MMEIAWLFGLFLVMLGFLLVISSFFGDRDSGPEGSYPEFPERKEKKFGGVVLIGPIPIVFGDARIAVIALILAIMLMLLSFSLIFGWFR
ncbi:MAG: DUF131 domain-containing protein [Archaeoglobales archaeon]|nr:DUF131 domain-containing protein [Archaeoglobales archaeon]